MRDDVQVDAGESHPHVSRQRLKRRGLIAGAAALIAGTIAKNTAQPVAAATTMFTDTNNQATNFTGILTPGLVGFQGESTMPAAGGASGTGLIGLNQQASGGIGVKGLANANGVGVQGGILNLNAAPLTANNTLAVQGVNFANGIGNTGVQGLIQGTGDQTYGMEGRNNGNGVGRIGVLGTIAATPVNTLTTGVVGLNLNTGSQAYGMFGTCDTAGGVGVRGQSRGGIGVIGVSDAVGGYGVLGSTDAPSSIAIAGVTTADGASCFSGGTTNPNSFAAYFQGHVVVAGSFDVSPLGNKHGVAEHPDGTHRTFYSVESPECWVEDFGEGKLVNGSASIALDPDFATLVHTDAYHVFITTHNDQHLHVSQRGANTFTVEADTALAALKGKKAADLSGTFSWRIVAKPKTTAKVDRLAKATLPNIPLPAMPKNVDPLKKP
ncbi:MAG: hypothetical protein M3008_06205 [Chloroflexota bacterium]|nr:hypothetical protein [Chloroflexota bacterium]